MPKSRPPYPPGGSRSTFRRTDIGYRQEPESPHSPYSAGFILNRLFSRQRENFSRRTVVELKRVGGLHHGYVRLAA